MIETDDNTMLDSCSKMTVFNSTMTEYQQNDRIDPIANICSKSGFADSDTMGEAITKWESSRYMI